MGEPFVELKVCPVCGENRFTSQPICGRSYRAMGLSPDEVAYINLQQGFCCASCKNNLRTMTLAAAVTGAFGFAGNFEGFLSQ